MFAKTISNHQQEEHRLGRNKITSEGAILLFDALRISGSNIGRISLSSNLNIDDRCMKSLGEYIKSNKSIQDVCLFENRITDIGLEILLPYFDGNKTFMRLFLHGNMLSKDKSIPLLLKIIEISCIEKLLPFEMTTPENKIFLAPLADNVLKNGNSNLSLVYQ